MIPSVFKAGFWHFNPGYAVFEAKQGSASIS